jgi:hypothetical protein
VEDAGHGRIIGTPRGLVALLAGLLSACAVGPDFVKPEPEMPPAYRSELTPSEAASFADEPWFDVFQDITCAA